MASERKTPIRVLIAKPGLDGHDRGAKVLAHAMREAGMEVVYSGLRQTPAMIVNAALHEDVDLIGISSHASNFALIEDLMELVEESDLADVPVVVGGHIPPRQIESLLARGVARIFPPGSQGEAIVDYLAANARGRGAAA